METNTNPVTEIKVSCDAGCGNTEHRALADRNHVECLSCGCYTTVKRLETSAIDGLAHPLETTRNKREAKEFAKLG